MGIDISLPTEITLSFRDLDHFRQELDAELEAWRWLETAARLDQQSASIFGDISSHTQNIRTRINNAQQKSGDEQLRHTPDIIESFREPYTSNKILHSKDPRSVFIFELLKEDPALALGALAYHLARPLGRTPRLIAGIMEAVARERTLKNVFNADKIAVSTFVSEASDLVGNARRQFEKLSSQYKALSDDVKKEEDTRKTDFSAFMEKSGQDIESEVTPIFWTGG